MALNDFENTIQGRFQGFESAPPEAVWTGINNLRNQRKKRIIILWWILPLATAACLGMGIYWDVSTSSIKLNVESLSTNIQSLTINTERNVNRTIETTNGPVNESQSPSSSKSNVGEIATSKSSQSVDNADNPLSTTSQNPTVKQPNQRQFSTDRIVDPLSVMSPKNNLIATHADHSDSKERLLLPSLTSLPLNSLYISSPSLELTQAYGTRDYSKMREHSFGLRMGTFVNISGVSANIQNATQPSVADETAEGFATYQRFIEFAPYYQFTASESRWSFQAHALYASSNLSVSNSQAIFPGRHHSVGLGVGTNYALINKRFSLEAYLNIQSEISFNRFTFNSKEWNAPSGNGGGVALSNPTNDIPESYRQFTLAGELGLRSSYVLNRSRWSITANAGFRNYFWQQNVSSDAVIRTPSMLHLNVGIRYTFLKNQ